MTYVVKLPSGYYVLLLNARPVEASKNAATQFASASAAMACMERHGIEGEVERA